MKKISILRLNNLGKAEIEKRQMNSLKGGVCGCICAGPGCGCVYEGPQCPVNDNEWGGSSTYMNSHANGDPNGLCADVDSEHMIG